ncbi:hypothetical protein AAE478_005103 [Parahypoxylon ruwenzoriense]
MGAAFDRVKTLARMRPLLPGLEPMDEAWPTRNNFNILEAFESITRYETDMVHWLSEIRILADPTLRDSDDIMSSSHGSFEAFWRMLVYNRGPKFNYESPDEEAPSCLGISFEYWYKSKKLIMERLWQKEFLEYVSSSHSMNMRARPFEDAESRVRDARRFFVTECGRFGWVPFRTQEGDRDSDYHEGTG